MPAAIESAKDTVILATNCEPRAVGRSTLNRRGNAPSLVCEDAASDPLTWIDSTTFEVVF